MKHVANYCEFELSQEDVAAATIYNTSLSISCYAWMVRYFSLVRDETPNLEQIHLKPMYINEVW